MAPPPSPGGDPGPLKKLDGHRSTVGLPKKGPKVDPKMARPWPANKLAALLSATNADRIGVLYPKDVAAKIHHEASERCLRYAEGDHPKEVAEALQRVKEHAAKPLTDAQAREILIQQRTFDYVSPLEPLSVMHARGLAGEPISLDRANTGAWSSDPSKAIAAAVPDKPGTYMFAVHMAGLSDASTGFTLVVEKKADGSSTMSQVGSFSTPVRDGKEALEVPVLDSNPARDGSRAVLVFPLNPTAVGGKK